jgi:hypothetical protein
MKFIPALVILLFANGLAASSTCFSGCRPNSNNPEWICPHPSRNQGARAIPIESANAMPDIKPFRNEEDSFSIDELTIENRLDRVSVYGSVQLTRDQAGLRSATQIRSVIDAVIRALDEDKSLPEHVRIKPAENGSNPFK